MSLGPRATKQRREKRIAEYLGEVRRAIHWGEWDLALSEGQMLVDELAAIAETDASESRASS